MGNPKIFVDANQYDLFNDEGQKLTWVYYLTHVLQVVYLLGFVATTVLFVNAYVVHTHFFPGAPNNDLYTERYTSPWWITLCFATLRFLFFLCMQWMFTYRNTLCCRGRYAGCTMFWLVLMVLILAMDCVGFVINTYYLAHCNGVDAFGNPCNSAGWCCLPEVRIRPSNHCPNEMSGSCVVPLPLNMNGTFVGLFAVNIVFLLLEIYFVALPLVLWFISFRSLPGPQSPEGFYDEVPTASAPPSEAASDDNDADYDPALEEGAAPTAPPYVDTKSRIGANASGVAVVRRPVVPHTPLLAAAAAARTNPITHVTPVTEKYTKQP
jgi:hypothetical protein